MDRRTAKYAWLTVGVALLTLSAKSLAAYTTGSIGLLSDAAESIINLASSLMLVVILRIAKTPPDSGHPYGHDKAEYFANGVQGALILVAGLAIAAASVERFLEPRHLQAGGIGLALAGGAGLMNFMLARYLKIHGGESRSNALIGEAEHLMADVWTSVAVLLGVGLVYITDRPWLDPLVAALVSVFILLTGIRLIARSVSGLMDAALPSVDQARLVSVLEKYKSARGIDYHALRTRVSGARTFVSVHILVPGAWTVTHGHDLLEELESEIARTIEGVSVMTHLEPLEEPSSFKDIDIA